jgi:phosphoribosylaminoimidazolecarboxamide formyltransferase/IMP cyclohydrolase
MSSTPLQAASITNSDLVKVKRALISVSDKTGIIEFCKFLSSQGVELISTGGTAKTLKEQNIPYTPIESITKNPESFGGRMKTISFQIGSALLFRRNLDSDVKEAASLGIQGIDLVVCNLYPFDQVARENKPLPDLIENIDIGGPTMIRAAAKNYVSVACLTSPADYSMVQTEIEKSGGTTLETRTHLALRTFTLIASYDLSIATELSRQFGKGLRYGENPHQRATLIPIHNTDSKSSLATARFIQGKELSYNNFLDADQAYKCASELSSQPTLRSKKLFTSVIVKHGIPCGVAMHADPAKSLSLAWDADSVSAFGSVICLDYEVTETLAHWFKDRFVEVIIAPKFTDGAVKTFAAKKNLRLLEVALKSATSTEWTVRSINGGLLCQDEDMGTANELNTVTKKSISADLVDVSHFGLVVTKYLKSNCIGIFGQKESGLVTISSGVGQPNRLDCITRLAGPRAHEKNEDLSRAVLVSDAFFPFRDSIEAAHTIGIHYIVQPGGSVRDPEVIEACNEFGIAMAFTGKRHFRH